MSGLLMTLLIVESALTLIGAALYVYLKRLEFQENDTMILDSAAEHLVAGQAEIRAKANRIERFLKYAGIGWLVFGVALLGVFLGEGAGLI